MTHEIHHIGKLLSVCRNPSCGSELFQQNDITAASENSIQ
ncbi:hypothetical protein [Bacillus atrophaeus]